MAPISWANVYVTRHDMTQKHTAAADLTQKKVVKVGTEMSQSQQAPAHQIQQPTVMHSHCVTGT